MQFGNPIVAAGQDALVQIIGTGTTTVNPSAVIPFIADANFVSYIVGVTTNFNGTLIIEVFDTVTGLASNQTINVVSGVEQDVILLMLTASGDSIDLLFDATVGGGAGSTVAYTFIATSAQLLTFVAPYPGSGVIFKVSSTPNLAQEVYQVGSSNEAPTHVSASDVGTLHQILGAPNAGTKNRLHRIVCDAGTGVGPIYLTGAATGYEYARCDTPSTANQNLDGLCANEALEVVNFGTAAAWTATLFWDLVATPTIY